MPQLDMTVYVGQTFSSLVLIFSIMAVVWLGRLLLPYLIDNAEGFLLVIFYYSFVRRSVVLTTYYLGGATLLSSWLISCRLSSSRRYTLPFVW